MTQIVYHPVRDYFDLLWLAMASVGAADGAGGSAIS